MDNQDLDPREYERRKKEQVEYRNKKRFSAMFMFFATVFEIIETMIIIFVLLLLDAIIVLKVLPLSEEIIANVFWIMLIVFFIGGLIIGFIIYKKTMVWVIKKFDLRDKLSDEILYHYKSKEEIKKDKEKQYMQ